MAECSIRNIKSHVEVPVLLLFFAFMAANPVTTNLIMYRTCYVTLNYNESDCALLGANYSDNSTAELERDVQSHATVLLMVFSVLGVIFPPLLCFFLGSWSDIYGRRPLILSTIGGCVLGNLFIVILCAIPSLSPWFLLLVLIPSCMSGGVPALLAAMFCYITDVTKEERRGLRMAMLQAAIALGSVLGTSSSSFILDAGGYIAVYAVCTSCTLLAWLYTFFFLPESVQNVSTEGRFRNLFRLSLIKTTFKATIKKREHYEQALLLTILLILILAGFVSYGQSGVLFLYLRRQFHWTLEKFTLYSSINNVTGIAGGIIGVVLLHQFLHIKEAFVMLIGFTIGVCGSLTIGMATVDWPIYLAGSMGGFGGAIGPMAQSLLSKIITTEDAGKVFSVLTALETASALAGSAAYTAIYQATLVSHPATFNFISCGLFSFEIMLVIAVLMMQRYQNQMAYRTFDNESTVSSDLNT